MHRLLELVSAAITAPEAVDGDGAVTDRVMRPAVTARNGLTAGLPSPENT